MKKIVTPLAAFMAIVFASLVAGCRPQKNPAAFEPRLDRNFKGTVIVAGGYSNFEALEEEFDRFNEYYPDIALSYEHLDDYNSSIRVALETDAAPDIYFTASWMLDKPSYEGLFRAAENLADPSLGMPLSSIRQELLLRTQDGQVPMVPVLSTTFGMLVNKDLFQKNGLSVPETYEELKAACRTFLENGYETPILGYNSQKKLFYNYAIPYFCSTISTIPGSVPLLNSLSPEAGKYLEPTLSLVEDLVGSGFINFDECAALKDEYNAMILRFFEGDIPIAIVDGDFVSGTKKRETQSEAFMENPFDYAFYTVPVTQDGGIFLNMSVIEFSVNKNSGNLAAANEFMRFLLSSQELNNLSKVKRLVTVSTDYSFDDMYSACANATPIYYERVGIMDNAIRQVRSAVWHVANGLLTSDEAMARFGTLPEED